MPALVSACHRKQDLPAVSLLGLPSWFWAAGNGNSALAIRRLYARLGFCLSSKAGSARSVTPWFALLVLGCRKWQFCPRHKAFVHPPWFPLLVELQDLPVAMTSMSHIVHLPLFLSSPILSSPSIFSHPLLSHPPIPCFSPSNGVTDERGR